MSAKVRNGDIKRPAAEKASLDAIPFCFRT